MNRGPAILLVECIAVSAFLLGLWLDSAVAFGVTIVALIAIIGKDYWTS